MPGSPALGVTLRGPLDQPDWTLDVSAIVKAFGARAIERYLAPQQQPQTAPDQGGAAAPEAAQPSPSQSLKPKDILRNLLKVPQ